jgi:hypothetical protein
MGSFQIAFWRHMWRLASNYKRPGLSGLFLLGVPLLVSYLNEATGHIIRTDMLTHNSTQKHMTIGLWLYVCTTMQFFGFAELRHSPFLPMTDVYGVYPSD